MSGYAPILHLALNHEYFSDGRCRGLFTVPSMSTTRMLYNADVLFRPTAGGFSLLAKPGDCEALSMYAEDDNDPFECWFHIYCDEGEFFQFTQPNLYFDKKVLLFQRQNLTGHKDNFSLHHNEQVGEDDFVLRDELKKLEIDLGGGLNAPKQKAFAIIKLRLYREDIESFNDKSEPPTYLVDFAAQQTFWKYYFIGDDFDSEVMVADLDAQVQFDSTGEQLLPGGRKALTFTSTSALGLRERSPYRFVLREKAAMDNGAGSKVLIKRLPVACASHRFRDDADGKNTAISEIYVNY